MWFCVYKLYALMLYWLKRSDVSTVSSNKARGHLVPRIN